MPTPILQVTTPGEKNRGQKYLVQVLLPYRVGLCKVNKTLCPLPNICLSVLRILLSRDKIEHKPRFHLNKALITHSSCPSQLLDVKKEMARRSSALCASSANHSLPNVADQGKHSKHNVQHSQNGRKCRDQVANTRLTNEEMPTDDVLQASPSQSAVASHHRRAAHTSMA